MAEKSENAYMKFISNWIAFNAICYNLYKEDAVKDRVEIDREKSKLEAVKIKFINTNPLFALSFPFCFYTVHA